jgi:hypothetical protein
MAWQYSAADIDHYYKLHRANCPNEDERSPSYRFTDAYDDWAKRHPPDRYPSMIVVAASGGGITAAQWTAQVLSNLQRDPDLQAKFGDSIAMISAVSGGAVGTMYAVNAYTRDGAPRDKLALESIDNQAGRSSLGAVGWGIVYPDFLRLLGSLPTFFIRKEQDRGWAIESRWAAGIIPDGTSMARWRDDVKQGWRPAVVFNGTVAETGERLVIAPVDIRTDKRSPEYSWPVRKLLYPGDDIDVVTAARLSATFPYVTPIARPDATGNCDDNRYHVADGGYTDNFGVLSAIDYLREIAPKIQKDGRKVVLLQIRASNPDRMPRPETDPGYLWTVTGPFNTLLSVRTPGQVARNDALIRYLQYEWEQKKIGEIKPVIFQLYKENPLSWHLSSSEKRTIAAEWSNQENQTALLELKNIMAVGPQEVRPNRR